MPILKGLRRRQASIDFMTAKEVDYWINDERTCPCRVQMADSRLACVSTIRRRFSRFIQKQPVPDVISSLRTILSRSNRRNGAIWQLLKPKIGKCIIVLPR